MLMYACTVKNRTEKHKNLIFCWYLKATAEKCRIRILGSVIQCTDPRIRIRIKMSRIQTLRILYSYSIIINNFGRPGIKTKESLQSALNTKMVAAQNELIRKTIFPQIKTLYGTRKGCELL
jgi:hypothetical protein